MASRHFTAAEKGKGVVSDQEQTGWRRVRAPSFDTLALIRDNALTLIGRVTNPKEQPIGALISALPRKWPLKGNVTGADLGQLCFQFRFELEEDLLQVLHDRPYNYNQWMLLLQRWEPVISPLFPSQIPFWIKLHGLPLHFWHEKMIYNIAHDLGTLEDYKITKTSARIRVSIDGLKPLIKNALVEFDGGVDLPITLDYEDLGYHCTTCNSLSHLARTCPTAIRTQTGTSLPPQGPMNRDPHQSPRRSPQASLQPSSDSFSRRIDRHGRPFGDRLPLPELRGRPLQNKIIPASNSSRDLTKTRNDSTSFYKPVPTNQDNRGRRHSRSRSPVLQWREKQRTNGSHSEARRAPQSTPLRSPQRTIQLETQEANRPPLERNLEVRDFPPPPRVPLREEVLEQLREDTFHYTNVEDPVEAAARLQRVYNSEENNLMEETASRIIEAAANNLRAHEESNRGLMNAAPVLYSTPRAQPETTSTQTPRSSRRTRDRANSTRRIQASPRIFAGTNLRKINISQNSTRHGFPHTAPIHSSQRRLNHSLDFAPTHPAASSSVNQGRESSDFHTHPPPLP